MKHVLLIAAALAATAGGRATASAQPAGSPGQGQTVTDVNRTAALVAGHIATETAAAKRNDAALLQIRRRMDSAVAAAEAARKALAAARHQGQAAAARVAQLTEMLDRADRAAAEAKLSFTAELAAKDRDYARERAILLSTAQRLLQSPEGRRALDLYNAGGRENWEEAKKVIDTMRRLRRAVDAREAALLYWGKQESGLETVANVRNLYEEVVRDDPNSAWDWIRLSRLYQMEFKLDRAEHAARQAASTALQPWDRAVALTELADIQLERNRLPEALSNYEKALAALRSLPPDGGSEPASNIGILLLKMGEVHIIRDEAGKALGRFEEALDHLGELADADLTSMDRARDLQTAYTKMGDALLSLGEVERASFHHGEALDLARRLAKAQPDSTGFQRDLSVTLNKVGNVELARNEPREALARYEEALAIRRKLAALEPGLADSQRDLSFSLTSTGDALVDLGQADKARARYREGLEIRRRLVLSEPGSRTFHRDVANSLWRLADSGAPDISWKDVAAQYELMRASGLLMPIDETFAREAAARAARGGR